MFTSIRNRLIATFALLTMLAVLALSNPVAMAACGAGASGGCAV